MFQCGVGSMAGRVSCVGSSGLFCRGRCKRAGDTMEEYEPVVFGFFCVQCILEGDGIYNVCSNMLVPPRKARIPGLRTYFDLTEYQVREDSPQSAN